MLATSYLVGRQFASHWWVFLVRGILALVFGVLIVAYPGAGAATLVALFGIYAVINGLMALYASSRVEHDRGLLIFVGLIGLAAGAIAFLYPGLTAEALALMLAIWAIFTGVIELIFGISLRTQIANEIWMILIGALTIGVGIVLVSRPGLALLTLVMLVALYAILAGLAFIGFAFRLKQLNTTPKT